MAAYEAEHGLAVVSAGLGGERQAEVGESRQQQHDAHGVQGLIESKRVVDSRRSAQVARC